jgi:hypothetical protein
MTRVVVAVFWLLHWLPLAVLVRFGQSLGIVL